MGAIAPADRIDVTQLKPRGFEKVEHVPKSSYKDCSTCVIVPSRDKWLHRDWVQMFNSLQWPMNTMRHVFYVTGAEVGRAYDELVTNILAHPDLSKWQYLLTVEDDVLIPPDGVVKLYESIDVGPFDAVSGMYFTKGDTQMPMAYGDPVVFATTGNLEFKPRDITPAIRANGVMEVNGIACGVSLYRMQLLKDVPPPRFVTSFNGTQDLAFCAKARRMAKRFAVDLRVRCGHADWASGEIY